MKVLITGADGFTARYVANLCKSSGHEVLGLVHHHNHHVSEYYNQVFEVDLLDFGALLLAIKSINPDYVLHLAAISFVAHGDVEAIYRTNVVGTRNLLQAMVDAGVKPEKTLLASSANVYGNADVEVIDENVPTSPANDYAVSKLAMEYVARLYTEQLPIVITRPFNYTGVGQSLNFLIPKIVDHFKRRVPVIELGNLDVARDFSDVRMVADCYERLLRAPGAVGNVYNVCSGEAYTLNDVLQMAEGITGHRIEVRVNPAFVRANEVRVLRGSKARLESVIGEVHTYALEDTLRWMLER